jgi:hypothetical protein
MYGIAFIYPRGTAVSSGPTNSSNVIMAHDTASCSLRFISFALLPVYDGTAYFLVHSLAVAMAACSSSFQLLATSAARGSSGLGAPRRAWIERRMVRIWRAGDQLSGKGRDRQQLLFWNTTLRFVSTYFSGHRDRCGRAYRRSDGKSWSGSESLAVSWDSPPAETVQA